MQQYVLEAGQLGAYQKEILNWAANVTKDNLQWTSTVPDLEGQKKRSIFDYQSIQRLYKLAQESDPNSVIEALAHNQLIDAYAAWTKAPGFRIPFLDKEKNTIEANKSVVLYGLSKQPILESQIVNRLANEVQTVSEQKNEEYQNTLQELNNLRALRQVEQRAYEAKNDALVQQLNQLEAILIRKDTEISNLEDYLKKELENERMKYMKQLDLAVQDAKEAIRKYDTTSIEYNQAKELYERRSNELGNQIMQLNKEKDECLQKYKKLNDLFMSLKQVLEQALHYYEQSLVPSGKYFGYSSVPDFAAIATEIYKYLVQVSSVIGQHSRIFGSK